MTRARRRHHLQEKWTVRALIVVLSAIVWVGSFMLHERYLPFLAQAPGIDLVFVPSGLRLLAILIGGIWAVIGVSIGGIFLTGTEFQTMQPAIILAIGLCSGLCPYIALRASLRATGVEAGLGNLTAARLPLICLGVAIVSAVLHNLLFGALGVEQWSNFTVNVLAMAAGDFLGILLAVVIAFIILRIYRRGAL